MIIYNDHLQLTTPQLIINQKGGCQPAKLQNRVEGTVSECCVWGSASAPKGVESHGLPSSE